MWEHGLYHKKMEVSTGNNTNGSSVRTMVVGTNVTSPDAIDTCYSIIFFYMSKFLNSFDEREKMLAEQIVSVCSFKQNDTVFLRAFFDHMLNNNHKDILLRVTSPELERWLVTKQKDFPDLLMNFYQIQGKGFEAGQVALGLAVAWPCWALLGSAFNAAARCTAAPCRRRAPPRRRRHRRQAARRAR